MGPSPGFGESGGSGGWGSGGVLGSKFVLSVVSSVESSNTVSGSMAENRNGSGSGVSVSSDSG